MGSYKYQVRDAAGKLQTGALTADSAASAAAILRNQGVRVVALTPERESAARASIIEAIRRANAGKPSQKHVLDFTTQLAVMIRAGINLRAALEGIAEQTTHSGFQRVIVELRRDVESGKQFSEALARHPKLFGPLYVNMVRASEMSGSFSQMLDRIAGYIAQQIETRKMVVGASIYPAIIAVLAVGVTIFLLTFVLPKFYDLFEGKEDVLPWATTFLMTLSKLLMAQWPVILGVVAATVGGIWAALRTHTGQYWFDRLKLTVPVLNQMFRSLYISRSLHTMGQLINAGVPMLDTISITGEISGNQLYKGLWQRVHSAVKQGRKLVTTLHKDPLLPKAVSQMISAGEESGNLGEVLDEISGYYTKKLKDNIKAVTSMIEPLMILVMGGIVGFIAMAIILPIFKMSQLVS